MAIESDLKEMAIHSSGVVPVLPLSCSSLSAGYKIVVAEQWNPGDLLES